MNNMPEQVINLIEKSSLVLFVVFATCAALLFSNKIVDLFSLTSFVETNKAYLGIGFIVTGTALVGKLVIYWYKRWQQHRMFIKTIANLTAEEEGVILQFIKNNSDTIPLSYRDGVIGGLTAKKIIFRASNVGHPGFDFTFDYNIQPWVKNYLKYNSYFKTIKSSNN